MFKEFKEFINRGNVMDLAIGVVLGGAFGAIVTALVEGVIMPFVGLLLGGVNVENLFFSLDGNSYPTMQAAIDAGAPVVQYGNLLQTIIDFLIISFVIFIIVKQINRMKRPVVEDPTTKECPYCKTEVPIGATRCPHCTSELTL